MSQQPPKKSGSRDINELKARLGLKKGAPAAGAKPNGSPSGGMVPPPGLSVPPPPGAGPQQPPVPNAADDPFGAMNAMAAHGASQRAPEIIIVNDGRPVESVSAGTQAATIGKYLAIALVPFILGIAIRGISKDAAAYNEGIRGAKALIADVKSVKKTLNEIKTKLESDAIRKQGLAGKDVTVALGPLAPDKLEIKPALALSRKQNIGDMLALSVMEFYTEVATLQTMTKDHLAKSKSDDIGINASRANSEKMLLPSTNPLAKFIGFRYGILIWNPSAEDAKNDPSFGAKLVELGPPYCGSDEAYSKTGTCPDDNPAATLAFRTGPGAGWQRADFATPTSQNPGDPVATKKVLTMLPTDVFQNFVVECANGAGGEGCVKNVGGSATLSLYQKRVDNIMNKLADVIELANDLERKLAPKAGESARFTFFM